MKLGRGLGLMLGLARRRARSCASAAASAISASSSASAGRSASACELAELAHRPGLGGAVANSCPRQKLSAAWALNAAMIEQDLAVEREGRRAPLQRFVDVGDDGVDAGADMVEDRLREGCGLRDIGVDARIAAQMMPPPSIRRRMPTTITNRLRLRPALPAARRADPGADHRQRDDQPIGPAEQGKEGDGGETSATRPMMIETMFNMADKVARVGGAAQAPPSGVAGRLARVRQ